MCLFVIIKRILFFLLVKSIYLWEWSIFVSFKKVKTKKRKEKKRLKKKKKKGYWKLDNY